MRPPATMPTGRTLYHLLEWISTQDWQREGEGFCFANGKPEVEALPANQPRPWRLVAYWTPGSNEGYYVHVSRLDNHKWDPSQATTRTETPLLTGKFLSLEPAQAAANGLTAMLWYLEDVAP